MLCYIAIVDKDLWSYIERLWGWHEYSSLYTVCNQYDIIIDIWSVGMNDLNLSSLKINNSVIFMMVCQSLYPWTENMV